MLAVRLNNSSVPHVNYYGDSTRFKKIACQSYFEHFRAVDPPPARDLSEYTIDKVKNINVGYVLETQNFDKLCVLCVDVV